MPYWFFGLQVLLMAGAVWFAFQVATACVIGTAFGGWDWDSWVMIAVVLAILGALGFLIYHPTFLWDLVKLIPLPPAPSLR